MMKKIVMVMLLPTTLVANAYAGTVSDSLRTTLYYRSGYSLLELSYMDNAAKLETLKQGIRSIGDNPNTVLQHIKILSAASPEGNSKLNKRLARRRGERLRDYLKEMLNLPDSVFMVSSAGEDWEGLALKIQKENAPWSRKALYIIRNTPEWIVRNGKVVDGRKRQLQNLDGGKAWKYMLANHFDRQRRYAWMLGYLGYLGTSVILLLMMATAFMGYLLPWGQMSYWGAQVIVNLFAAIPFVGPDLALLIRGDFVVGDATLNRFFSFHVIAVPLVLLGLVVAHLLALHDVGSNNPDGVEIKAPNAPKDAKGKPLDGVPFHPYYTVHDIFALSMFLMAFTAVVFFAPEFGGYFLEYNNFIPADPMVTPLHIAPVWYFTPFYSMLRAITSEMMYALIACVVAGALIGVVKGKLPGFLKAGVVVAALVAVVLMLSIDAKFWGVVVMGGAVIILFFLPWLDTCAVKSIRYRPTWHKYLYAVFVINFLILGYLGVQPPSPVGERVSQVGTLFYFGFFLLMPWWSSLGATKPVPDRVNFTAH